MYIQCTVCICGSFTKLPSVPFFSRRIHVILKAKKFMPTFHVSPFSGNNV